jgi:oligosaccharide reducing-end xylanase
MKASLVCLLLFGFVLGCSRAPEQRAAAHDTPARVGSALSGEYPNLFAEAGYRQGEIDTKVRTAFEQLFHGDPESEALYFPAGTNEYGPLAYIYDVNSADVRSEGMSYGMMIAVQMDDKETFDAIWNWAKTHMYHSRPDHPARGFFAWSVKTSGEPIDEMPAPDGEEYFITALFFAAARGGKGEGIFD